MASTGAPPGSRGNPVEIDDASDSGSSYIGSDGPSPRSAEVICPWRTDRYYNEECSRYMDCPTHTIERSHAISSVSTDDSHNHEQDGQSPATRRRRELSAIRITGVNPLTPAVGDASPRADLAPHSPHGMLQEMRRTPQQTRPTLRGTAQASPAELVLPRWQPDAEVTYCPICHTQFSFFVRKHHCRKCGRVVCDACSPHRITIPYQYIVQPPGVPRLPAQRYASSPLNSDGSYADFSPLGGGERVRLCNPCVPDPNTSPPQLQDPFALRTHLRSRSGIIPSIPGGSPGSQASFFTTASSNDAAVGNRRATMSGNILAAASTRALGNALAPASRQSRVLSSTPPAYFPSASSSSSTAARSNHPGMAARHRSLFQFGSGPGLGGNVSSPPSASTNRRLPPIPGPEAFSQPYSHARPQIAEEDECPICHEELPSRTLPDFEAQREAHINTCIQRYSRYGTTPTSSGPSPMNDGSSAAASPPPLRPGLRRTGIFLYAATEKDLVDSAECTICLEDFEVGARMGRLECLCRFHERCIRAWWERHPGRCPMHHHDGFGF